MYQIILNGAVIAITEKVNYIRQDGAVYVGCDEAEAQGVAVKNKPYNLLGREPMGEIESVVIFEVDGGRHIETGENSQTETDVLVIDHEYRLTLLELGVLE